MIKLSISQAGYPKKIVINKDTLCALTIPQVDSVNKAFVTRDECYELRDSLFSQIGTYDALVNNQRATIKYQDKEIDLKNKIIAQKDTIIKSDENKIAELKGEKNKFENKIKWLKFQRTIFPIAGIVIGVLTMILITQ